MPTLKPLARQAIVLTGATSGIGLATAREAAKAGARLVLVARNAAELDRLAAELNQTGTEAIPVTGDVAEPETHRRAAEAAREHFGGFDSWVNNAGAFIYGRVDATPEADQRRLFDVTYWGTVHGSLEALRHLKRHGGALVNIGSVLSERAIALQGPYSAAKFAVKAITDVLRMETMMETDRVSVTLIKPGPIDTPYMEHARNLTGAPGTRNPPPAYHPRVVAKAVLHACRHPVRDLTVGGGGAATAIIGQLFPALTDAAMVAMAYSAQTTDDPGRPGRRDNLYAPREDGAETSSLSGPSARRSSLFLEAQMNPLVTAALGVAGVAALMLLRAPRRAPLARDTAVPRRMQQALPAPAVLRHARA